MELDYIEVLGRVKSTNTKLMSKGLTLKQIDAFWRHCIKDVRKDLIIKWFNQGLNDTEIAKKTGYHLSTINDITTKHFNDLRNNKINSNT
jgi:hypothetical protein